LIESDQEMIIEINKDQLASNVRLPRKRSVSSSGSNRSNQGTNKNTKRTKPTKLQAGNDTIMEDEEQIEEDESEEEEEELKPAPAIKRTLGRRTTHQAKKSSKTVVEVAPPNISKKSNEPRKFDNEYDRVCSQLQLSAIPDVLPCRDRERN
jgi:hypothetical protein